MPFCRTVPLLLAALIVGCAEKPSGEAAALEAASRQMKPTDSTVAALYNRSCRNCHTIAATGAPLTGDSAAWAPRMAQGMDTMVENVVAGVGGMPPFGMCMDCDYEQFSALIEFMASGETP
jgi:cytochrome c5